MLHEYTKQKECFLEIYEMLEKEDSKFVDENLKSELLEKKSSLLKDQFILAVAGQMKAGKSTLLNALIFGNNILPADDTELTAKITFITYGEEPSYEATLYTSNEFVQLRNSIKGTESESEFNKLLNTSLENLQNRGYSSYEELLSEKNITGKNLKELIDFVGKNGVFTPFVNTLTLKTNSSYVKNLIVVDTPGMNSPNQMRDKVVKDWIGKANAVLYCSYAGAAMNAVDVDFVKDYMLHISPNHRLFPLTKSDTINGEDRLTDTIDDMVNGEWNKKYNLIPGQDTVFPVCQLAVMLDKMDKNSLPFTPAMEEEYEKLENRIDFEHCHIQFSNLESAIERKLIANKDSNMIETHQQYLTTLFSEPLLEIKEDIDSCKKSLELIKSDKKELEKKEIQIRKDIKFISASLENIEDRIKNHFDESSNNIKISAEIKAALNIIMKRLEGMSLDDLEKYAANVIEEKLRNGINNLKEQIKTFTNDFSKGLQRIFDTSNLQLEYLNSDFIKDKIEIKCRSFINSKIGNLKDELETASNSLKTDYSKNINFWRKFKDVFKSNKTRDIQRGEEALQKFVSETLNPMSIKFNNVERNFFTDLNYDISEIFRQIQDENNNKLEEKEKEIEILKNKNGKDIEERMQVEQSKYNALKVQEKELETLIAGIKSKINFM